MDKQKQIKEMAKIYCQNGLECDNLCQTNGCRLYEVCTELYNAGYRKIPENAVVLTEEELFTRDEKIHKADREYIKALEECINNRNAKASGRVERRTLRRGGGMMDGNFNGNLKQIIMAMIGANTDCCEATHTVGDISVTLDITITKIVKAGETVYEAVKDEVEE